MLDRRARLPPLIAIAAVAACLAASFWHIRAHTMPPTFDDAWYLENSFRFYHALAGEGPSAFFEAYVNSFRFKAPLISVLPLPIYSLVGPGVDAATFVNLAAMILLATYLYMLGRRLQDSATGALAVLIAMTTPMLFGLSRKFLVEYWLAALVTASAYHLAASEGLRREKHVRILGVLFGVGLLLKSIFPFYLLGPFAVVLYGRYRELNSSFLRNMEKPLKTIVYIAAPIALTWYASNLVYTVGYAFRASFGDIAAHYGGKNVWAPSVLLPYWMTLVADGPSLYYFLSFLALTPILLKARGLEIPWSWLLFPLAVASIGVNKDTRFMTPCLPAFAVLLAYGLRQKAKGALPSQAALAAFFLFPIVQYSSQTFGVGPVQPSILPRETNYSHPPKTDGQWSQAELVDAIAAECGGPCVAAVGAEHRHLNANNLACLAALKGYPVSFISYGYEESRIERVVQRLLDRDAGYLIMFQGLPEAETPESVRKINPQVQALIDQRKLPYTLIRRIRLTPTLDAILYRRHGPIKMIGAPR